VHSYALKLNGNQTLTAKVIAYIYISKFLHKLSVCRCMTYSRISRYGLSYKGLAKTVLVAYHLTVNATMLVTKGYHKV
jgi:hypothetical protein